jgi:lysophospholipase L1-like esterase
MLRSATITVMVLGTTLAAVAGGAAGVGQAVQPKNQATTFKFAFSPGKIAPGYVQVLPTATYSKDRGYGFDLNSKVIATDFGDTEGYCASPKGFFFSVDLPEGNYDVKVVLAGGHDGSTTTIKAESRRLMLEQVEIARNQVHTGSFTVNIRNSKLASGGQVKLKDREIGVLHWDDKLTLEFAGERPRLSALEITKNDTAITVYLAGDSTVTDQTKAPYASWGQMLPRFFKAGAVAIANHAESGEATTSFIGAKRLEKILDTLKKGDYLFVQFGHNDQNQKRPIATYKTTLKRYVDEARKREAIPVLVVPMNRRLFDASGKVRNSLAEYPDAIREVAREQETALIDLQVMSNEFYEALGPVDSKLAFVDNTHTNEYGAYEFARYIAATIEQSKLGLAKHVVVDLPPRNFIRPPMK